MLWVPISTVGIVTRRQCSRVPTSHRVVLWLVFRLVERLWGVAVSARGYRLFGLDELTVKTDDSQLVRGRELAVVRKRANETFTLPVMDVQMLISRQFH